MNEHATAPASGADTSFDNKLTRDDKTWGGEFGALFKLGWPLIVAQLAQNALLTTDVIMIGWLGGKYLAAAALANALFICIQLFGVGVTSAVAPMVAQAIGKGDLRSVRRTVRQGFWVAIVLVALLFPIAWNIRPIYDSIGQDPELSALAEIFVHYAIWLFVPAFMIVVARSFLSALGATRAILVITLIGVVMNFVCNYVLIFGNWGFPRLELAGAGIATTLVNFAMLAMMLGYIVTHRRYRRYHILARFFEPDWSRFFEIWRIGGPIGFMLLAEVGLFTCAALLQGWLGTAEVAAHSVALQLAAIAFMVPLGLGQATTVRVGIAVGENNPEGVRKAGWSALLATLLFMSLTCALFLVIPHQLVSLFLDPTNAENFRILTLAASYLGIVALFQLADGAQVAMVSALRGISDTKVPLVVGLVGYWAVGAPVAYLLGFHTGLRGIGIWLGLALGLVVVAVVLIARFSLREKFGLVRAMTRRDPAPVLGA